MVKLNTEDKKDYFKTVSKDYKDWSKRRLVQEIRHFLKETKQWMDWFELQISAKAVLQDLYKHLINKFLEEEYLN